MSRHTNPQVTGAGQGGQGFFEKNAREEQQPTPTGEHRVAPAIAITPDHPDHHRPTCANAVQGNPDHPGQPAVAATDTSLYRPGTPSMASRTDDFGSTELVTAAAVSIAYARSAEVIHLEHLPRSTGHYRAGTPSAFDRSNHKNAARDHPATAPTTGRARTLHTTERTQLTPHNRPSAPRLRPVAGPLACSRADMYDPLPAAAFDRSQTQKATRAHPYTYEQETPDA